LNMFGIGSPFAVVHGDCWIAAALDIALAIAKPLSSKVTDQRVESTGHRSILH
jgi:hypothetical protein